MAGYDWSKGMSNNAVNAYENGEKPLSKWTKKEILSELENLGWNIENFKKFKVSDLKSELLEKSSWHHTSKFFNETNFYCIEEGLEENEALARLNSCVEKEILKKQQEEEAINNLQFKCGDIIYNSSVYGAPQLWLILSIDNNGCAELLNVCDHGINHGRWIMNANILNLPNSWDKWELYF